MNSPTNFPDPSQLFIRNFQAAGLRELLRRYELPFPSNLSKPALFASLQALCIVMYPVAIYPSPQSLIITDFSIDQIKAILARYGQPLQTLEDLGLLSQQLLDYLLINHPVGGYGLSLYINPWSFLRENYSSKASLQELLRARGVEFGNGAKTSELF